MLRPGCFDPRKEIWYNLYRILVGLEGQPGQVKKISPPSRFDPWTDQASVSPYTNYTIPNLLILIVYLLMMMVYLYFLPFRWHDVLKSSLDVLKVTLWYLSLMSEPMMSSLAI